MTITFLAPDGVAVTAQQERQAKAAQHGGGSGRQLGGRSGFRVGTPSNILTATSTTWTLGPCAAEIDPGASTHQGMYGWASDANITGSGPTGVVAADATNPRKDIVYILVNDSSAGDGSGTVFTNVLYLAGTPSATPAAPALPARSFLVGTITVPQVSGGSPTVVLNPARYVAAGAPLPVESQTAQDALTQYPASEIIRTDDKYKGYISDGTKWMPHPDALGLVVHQQITASGGSVTALTVINNIASFAFKGGRKYRIVWDFSYQGNTAGNYVTALIGTAATADAAALTTGITQRNGRPFKIHDAAIDSPGRVEAVFVPSADDTLQLKFLIQVTTGAGTARISGSTTQPVDYTIEDLGAQF